MRSPAHIRDITWVEAWEALHDMRRSHLERRWADVACCRTCNVWSIWDDSWFKNDPHAPIEARAVDYASKA